MSRTGVVRCLIAALLFGATAPLTSELAESIQAFTLAGLLYVGAAIAVSPSVLRRPPSRQALAREWRPAVIADHAVSQGRPRPRCGARTGHFRHRTFIGAAIAWIVLGDAVEALQIAAVVLAAAGVGVSLRSDHEHDHRHDRLAHDHEHVHDDNHSHHHDDGFNGRHSHPHRHEALAHAHLHVLDLHHRHDH